MTKTTRNRLFAGLLAIIPVASYYYFLNDFISSTPEAEENNVSGAHRYRIDQNKSVPIQRDQSE
ncbi:MAG TPA: hypothetical protein ENJ32_08385 [Crenotrichaceae bacterium]|nr:hypothetical protein [Crenotrichaceae bacterium]